MQLTKCAVNNNSDPDSDFDGLVGAARMQIYSSGTVELTRKELAHRVRAAVARGIS